MDWKGKQTSTAKQCLSPKMVDWREFGERDIIMPITKLTQRNFGTWDWILLVNCRILKSVTEEIDRNENGTVKKSVHNFNIWSGHSMRFYCNRANSTYGYHNVLAVNLLFQTSTFSLGFLQATFCVFNSILYNRCNMSHTFALRMNEWTILKIYHPKNLTISMCNV